MSLSLVDTESIVAISATFHTHPEYQKFYDKHSDCLSGFPGIWNMCAKMSMAFVEAERSIMPDWDGKWIEAIDAFVTAIYEKASTMEDVTFTDDEFLQIAKDTINKTMKED